MALELPFVTLDVFTTERYKGNPLAIVTIPKGTTPYPTQDQKQRIAREFNYSETVFVHEHHPAHNGTPDGSRHIDIFVTDAELPFAGHPTIGTATHLLPQSITTLITKAGPITIDQPRPGVVFASIPHNTRLHASRLRTLASLRPGDLSPDNEIRAAELDAPIFSIVRGMAFCLIELPSLDALSRVTLTPAAFRAEDILDEGWRQGFVGRYYFVRLGGGAEDVVSIRSRMMAQPFEDPATGSAACALSSYLTLTSGNGEDGTVTYKVDQGVEMGRESNIVVEITTQGAKIDKVSLSGTATQVMRGFVTV
jgi:PhzF family phenazine biosynthesis protein